MDDAKWVSERARAYSDEGFNCAESVALNFRDYFGIENSILPKLATGGREKWMVIVEKTAGMLCEFIG